MTTRRLTMFLAILLLAAAMGLPGKAEAINPGGRLFTTGADFASGTAVGVNHTAVADQLQLNTTPTTFPFIWVSDSDGGMVSKLNTSTGVETGRYWSAPNGTGRNPSRTTVDQDGNVWVGNRDSNTVTKIGQAEAGNCIDRNGNGLIDTSTGPSDVKAWTTWPPVDECILLHVVLGTASGSNNNVRAVAIDHNNNVFVGMSAGSNVYQINGLTGALIQTFNQPFSGNYPSYGAVVDPEGNLWISGDGNNQVVKHTFTPAGLHDTAQAISLPGWSYGMALDNAGNIWVSGWTNNNISKIRRTDGVILATYNPSGASGLRGVAMTSDGDIWVASSYSNTVIRLNSDGTLDHTYPVGSHPTGVSVDADGNVWVTNYYSSNVTKINPTTHAVIGTYSVGPGPYNYSDMTGSVVRNMTSQFGTWTAIQNGGTPGMAWGTLSWNGSTPTGTSITARVRAADSTAGLGGASWVPVTNGVAFSGVAGQYIQLEVKLTTPTNGVTPIVTDVTIDPIASAPCEGNSLTWLPPLGSVPAEIGTADTLDIGFKWMACNEPAPLDRTVTVRVRKVVGNALVSGFTYGAGTTYNETNAEYHQPFVVSKYNLPAGTQLKVMVYFGGSLKGTALVNVH